MSLAVALPALSAAVSALTYKLVWIDSAASKTSVPYVVRSCSQTISFASLDKTTPSLIAKELICIRLSYLRSLFADRSGVGALLVFSSVLVPLFMRLSYHAASPNNRSFFQGPLLPMLLLALTSIDILVIGRGVTLLVPTIVATLYTIGALSRKHPAPEKALPVLPCQTQPIYGANLATVLVVYFLISTILFDDAYTSEAFWWEEFVPAQFLALTKPFGAAVTNILPMLVLPVLLLGYRHIQRPKTEAEAAAQLADYNAPEIAYGYERTWAYYRQSGLLSFFAYVWGMSRLYRGLVFDRSITPQAQYVLMMALSLAITLVTVVVLDAQTTPADPLDEEAIKAISKAPAGNPGVEDNLKVLIPLGLVAGPGLPAMLWFAHQEEIKGWKGRRAWRLNSSAGK